MLFGLNNYRERKKLEIDKEIQEYRESFYSKM